MFDRILIANRGEIAVRIIQACRDLGLETVAVHSDADREARHVALADASVCIGPASVQRSYLDQDAILTAAELTRAGAIHPGYGFLAENPGFARRVEESGRVWIGPRAETIELMGDKAAARRQAEAAGVPVLPGTPQPPENAAAARERADEIGYPVLLKAVSGGGGKGMRVVRRADELERQFDLASSEASSAFGDGRIYVEKFLVRPRHVEIQVFGDGEGGGLHLGARECSLQRRHQKLLEESPPPGVGTGTVTRMARAAVELTRSLAYVGAGTVEFLLDDDERFYFMEMNTRIQVEHPVTEVVTGTDLVVAQIQCARGRPHGLLEDDAEPTGHAIECRINAEDPVTFAPSPGLVERLIWPTGPGVRVDSHVVQGYRFPPFYDSLLGKLIVHGADRRQAIARMRRALEEFEIEGIRTTAALHRSILRDPDFVEGRVDTGFIERFLER